MKLLSKFGASTAIGIVGSLLSVVAGVMGALETQKEAQKIAEEIIKEQSTEKK